MSNNAKITVFTPSYNRSKLLHRCYNSLKNQSDKRFIWMIIDDGSTDNTNETVQKMIKEETSFEIKYFYKENGGLHTAYNLAIKEITTELAVCIDSDDYMPNNAVALILSFWEKNGSKQYAGITGLDYYAKTEQIVGGMYPRQKSINLIDVLVGRYPAVYGDKKHVVRTELYKKYAPMKVYDGEKNFNPHYLHLLISCEKDFLILNKNLCFVEYQTEGMTNSILYQYYNSPNSFADTRLLYLSFRNLPVLFKIKNTIHYASSCILAKRKKFVSNSPNPFLTLLCCPLGLLLSIYIFIRNQ